MIKICIFNKGKNVLRFDISKKFFECVNSGVTQSVVAMKKQ